MEYLVKKDEKIEDVVFKEYDIGDLDYESPNKIIMFVDNYNKFSYDNQFGNCKVCTLQNLQTTYFNNPKKTLERLDELFDVAANLMFFTTFTKIEMVEEIKKIYEVVYIIKVPIGYEEGYQYHCGFLVNKYYDGQDDNVDLTFEERIKTEGVKLIS